MAPAQKPRTPKRLPLSLGGGAHWRAPRGSLRSSQTPGSTMNRCADARAVAATVPGADVGNAGLRPPMVPRQASFFPPPVPNPFVQQTRLGVARRIQVRGEGLTGEVDSSEGHGLEGGGQIRVRDV